MVRSSTKNNVEKMYYTYGVCILLRTMHSVYFITPGIVVLLHFIGTMSWDDSEAGEGEEERSKKQGKNSLFQERTHPDSDREAKVEIKTERQG